MSTSNQTARSGVLAVLTATLFWSFGGVLGKSTGASGVVMSFWRLWIAAGVLLVALIIRGARPRLAEFRKTAIAGVLFGLNVCVFFVALETVSIATALIIAALGPVVALPVSVHWYGERMTWLKYLCAGLSVAGVVVAIAIAPPNATGEATTITGYLWCVFALFLWIAYLLVSKGVRSTVATLPFMFNVSFIGALTLSLVAVVGRHDLGQLHGSGWLWVTCLALGPGIAGHGLVVWAQPRIDASVTTILIQAEPVGASIVAWWILGETVSFGQAIAMSVVIVALCALALSESKSGSVEIIDAVG